MSSTFGSFEAAKSGLSIAMRQLNVTEQNITNVNTAGYTRQRLTTAAKEPGSSDYLIAQIYNNMIGQGVEATGVQQIRSAYLDQQFRNLNSNYNYSTSRNQALSYLDGLFKETDTESGLTTSIENFFGALKDFTSDTSSKAFRTNVQQQGISMTDTFNAVYGEMVSLWNDQNSNINTVTQKINSIGEKIAQLNDSIARSMQLTGTANELTDQRNLLLDELSGYANITYSYNTSNNNMIDVKVGDASLVKGNTAGSLGVTSISGMASEIDKINKAILTKMTPSSPDYDASYDPQADSDRVDALVKTMNSCSNVAITSTFTGTPPQATVKYDGVDLVTSAGVVPTDTFAAGNMKIWVDLNRNNVTTTLANGTVTGITNSITSGQLHSSIEMTSSNAEVSPGIPYYIDQLNTLVRNIAEQINSIHQQGYTYPDGSLDSKTNINFFEVPQDTDALGHSFYNYKKINAGNFSLSQDVLDSVYNIAGSSKLVKLDAESTETGNNEIAQKMLQDLENSGYYDKLDSIVNNLAITSNTSESIMKTRQSLVSSADTQRTSMSGVSLDEETTNLIVYQQSYQAAARIISTLDDMLSTMINNMGITGR